MKQISSVRDLINLWPKRSLLVEDLNALHPAHRITIGQVNKWAQDNPIPAKYHHHVLVAAYARGLDIDADLLVMVHAPKETLAKSHTSSGNTKGAAQ